MDDELVTDAVASPAPDSLDLDDAFADGDDNEPTFQLSKAAIREELAKYRHDVPEDAEDDDPQRARSTNGFPNVLVSALDVNGSAHGSPVSDEARITGDESEMASVYLSAASLPDELHADDKTSEPPPEEDDTEKDVVSYPSVIIDVSKFPHSRVEVVHCETSSPVAPSASENTVPEESHERPSTEPVSSLHKDASLSPSESSSSTSRQRTIRSSGPSALEKVVNRTRPSFLPPKSRQEDDKHMADWEEMMKASRLADIEEHRRKALQERRLMREKKIEESLHIWEKEVVPDWCVVHRNPTLRKLWWKGIPTKLRASMWELAVGNALALSKDNYRACLARAKRALTNGNFPTATMVLIEEDIATTLPSLHIFHPETGPLYQDLKDMLCAWVVARSDEGLGYPKSSARIAAMFLLNMPPQQAFVVMRNLLERHCLRSFYGGASTKDDVEAYYRIFDTLLADGMPKIYFNFKQHQISPAAYLPDWLLPLFLDHLPFEACARVWDVILLEGDAFLYRAALGVLGVLEPRLFFPDRRELLECLKGENRAALEVARREGRPLDGGKYEIYGLDEETLWERIDMMEEWWKESTWTRLIQRELPDL